MGILNYLFFKYAIKSGNKQIERLKSIEDKPFEVEWDGLKQRIESDKDTEYGRKIGLEKIENYDQFRNQIAFSSYSDYEPYITKMQDGETGLMTNDNIEVYALTSGSVSNPKSVPNTTNQINAAGNVMQGYSFAVIARDLKKRNIKLKNKKIYQFMQSSYTLLPDGTPVGSISGYQLERMKNTYHLIFATPKEAIFPVGKNDVRYIHARALLENPNVSCIICAFMSGVLDTFNYISDNLEMLLGDIAAGTISKDVQLSQETIDSMQARIRPRPKHAKKLRTILEGGFTAESFKKLFKNCAFLFSVGTGSFASKTEKVRKFIGDMPIYFSLYGSSEGLFALSPALERPAFLMMPEVAFHEFIPLEDTDDAHPKALHIGEVKIGKSYEMVLSNMSGMYRYRMKDVVKVVDKQGNIPIIEFEYRLSQLINLAGEKTNEKHVMWAVEQLEKQTDLNIGDFSVEMVENCSPQKYCIYLEKTSGEYDKTLAEYEKILDDLIAIANPSYGTKVQTKILSPLQIKFVERETYLLYNEIKIAKGVAASQIKPVRIIMPEQHKFFNLFLDKAIHPED